jgi:hypothetical protein
VSGHVSLKMLISRKSKESDEFALIIRPTWATFEENHWNWNWNFTWGPNGKEDGPIFTWRTASGKGRGLICAKSWIYMKVGGGISSGTIETCELHNAREGKLERKFKT